MELFLNLGWAVLGLGLLCLWYFKAPEDRGDRRASLVALIMLIVILFPVISVSDDLWAMQNPVETDCIQRRDHLVSNPHSLLPVTAVLDSFGAFQLTPDVESFSLPAPSEFAIADSPDLHRIQNRPPPAA